MNKALEALFIQMVLFQLRHMPQWGAGLSLYLWRLRA